MSFLNPVILFGLFAASLPVLIHLFTRQKTRTIPFSTLEFLKELEQKQIRRIRLRQILLLILRTLIIILIILAFARPTLRQTSPTAAHANAQSSLALVLDNSFSMTSSDGNETLFEKAKTQAQSILDLIKSGDEAFVCTTTDTTDELWRQSFHDAERLHSFINEINISESATNITASIDYAARLLRQSANLNKEMYVISDFQQSGFVDSLQAEPGDIKIYGIPLNAESVANLSIKNVEILSTILETGKVIEAQVRIKNTGTVPLQNSLVQFYLADQRVAQTSVSLSPGENTVKTFRFVLDNTGFLNGRLVLEDDDILQDNRRYFTLYVPEQTSVLLSGHQPRDTQYVSLVLGTSEKNNRFIVAEINEEKLSQHSYANYDVVLLSNLPAIDEQQSSRLKSFVENGGGLIFALGENVDLRAYNQALSPLDLPRFVDVIGSYGQTQSGFSLQNIDRTHPIFTGIFENPDAKFARPEFYFAIKAEQTPNVDEIMTFSDGSPLLFEKKLGRGIILVFTTGFDVQLSDIVHRTIFAPLISRMVRYAGTRHSHASQEWHVKDEIRFKIPPEKVEAELTIQRPDRTTDQVKATVQPDGDWIHYPHTDGAGIYSLLMNDELLHSWAVNVEQRESELNSINKDILEKQYRFNLIEPNANFANIILSQRYGQELWPLFLVAALFLLFLEMLIYRERGETPVSQKARL